MLNAVLALARRRTRASRLLVHQRNRAPRAGVARGQQTIRIVLFDAPCNIPGDPRVQAAVRAAKDINRPGRFSLTFRHQKRSLTAKVARPRRKGYSLTAKDANPPRKIQSLTAKDAKGNYYSETHPSVRVIGADFPSFQAILHARRKNQGRHAWHTGYAGRNFNRSKRLITKKERGSAGNNFSTTTS